jgi:hypothetical protein
MVVEELGRRFEVMRTDIKKWSVGAPIQAPLDAPRHAHQARAIRCVAGEAGRWCASRPTRPPSSTTAISQTSICSILIAVMLLDKTVSFKAAHDIARMKDPAVLRERAKGAAGAR